MKITKRNIKQLIKKGVSINDIREEIEKQHFNTDSIQIKKHLDRYTEALYFYENNTEDLDKLLEFNKQKSYEIQSRSIKLISIKKEILEEEKQLSNRINLVVKEIDKIKLIKEFF